MPTSSKWFVYIIRSKSGKLYTGITTDIERRFEEHKNNKKKGAKFFRSDPAKEIVYTESFKNRSEASKKEAEIKKLTRKEKEELLF